MYEGSGERAWPNGSTRNAQPVALLLKDSGYEGVRLSKRRKKKKPSNGVLLSGVGGGVGELK